MTDANLHWAQKCERNSRGRHSNHEKKGDFAIGVYILERATKIRDKQQRAKVKTVTHHDHYPTTKGKTKEKTEKEKPQRPTSINNKTSCPFLSYHSHSAARREDGTHGLLSVP